MPIGQIDDDVLRALQVAKLPCAPIFRDLACFKIFSTKNIVDMLKSTAVECQPNTRS